MITHDEWLGALLSRNLISPPEKKCEIGLVIPDTHAIDSNIKYGLWKLINEGIENKWITDMGCIVHEKKAYNYMLDVDHIEGIETTPNSIINIFIQKAQEILPCDTFIDIGSGTGEVLAFAQNTYQYLYGIDTNESYVEKSSLLVPHATINTIDAKNYLLPPKESHIYLFNPFSNDILEKFLIHNIHSIREKKSLILFYNNYRADHVLKAFDLQPIWQESHFAIYQYTVPPRHGANCSLKEDV